MRIAKFVEDKIIDWERVAKFLKLSSEVNQWTNFGPVSKLLESNIHRYLNLDPDLAVVVCCSATIALDALIDMQNLLHQRELRWVVSSYGFYCTIQGSLARSHVADCDSSGFLDLKALKDLDYDGIVATNIFGLKENMDEYADFCRKHKKIYICDSAKAFVGIKHGPNEIISFHHTKPWGVGEGGCVIVERKYEELFRSLINFGLGIQARIPRFGTNGKLSDIASAFILQRLEELPQLEPIYQKQYQRIAQIAQDYSYRVMNDVTNHPGIPPNVPLLKDSPIHELENPYVDLRKYYKPLEETPHAYHLYERIINFPCHPGVQNITDQELKEVFSCLKKANKASIR